jgi:hypothetical protein
VADRLGRRDERGGDGDDLVARLEVERPERQLERIGAVAHPHRVRRIAVRGERALELAHRRTLHERRGVEHLLDRGVDLGPQIGVLGVEVDKRNRHRSGPKVGEVSAPVYGPSGWLPPGARVMARSVAPLAFSVCTTRGSE